MKNIKNILLCLAALLMAGCATSIQSTVDPDVLDTQAKWALLPIANNTDTPQAALSAEAMLEHQLRRRGITTLLHYPAMLSRDSLFEPTERKVSEEAQQWAIEQGARFALTGSVEEWRYKVGIDGEPAVGVTLKVIDLTNGRVVWSASGAKSGWSRQALSAVAQALLADLLGSL
ncbi:MAG: penicillin-binding protein activator LpoB [Rhodoferax sp.]|jgi:TolB-like protein|uniref:penicillin-binding protein activator LpoB n=1 Tax=Rhodoferax sp. TaxID=50421 RepID=UPI0017E43D4F|nr:penicillin-binding protein activator LpoB [Rhodoferax sp.]NMM14727.1 penicillin-binding protein activator LpoB [Rhodoferax sp.]